MKKIYFIAALMLTLAVNAQQTITWTNGNSTGIWSDPLNWDVGVVPTNVDDVVFDGTQSNASCTMDMATAMSALTEMNNLTIGNGYSGTISGIVDEIYVYGDYNQSSGTLNAGTNQFSIFGNTTITGGNFAGSSAIVYHGGNFSLATGTYDSSTGTTDFEGLTFTKTSGTFNHNNGVWILNVAGTTNVSGTLAFSELQVTPTTASPVLRTVAWSGAVSTVTVTLVHGTKRFRYTGTISVTDMMKIVSGTSGVAAGNTGIFNFNGGNATIASSVAAGSALLGNVTINTAGVLSMSGNISLNGTWLHTSVGGFNTGTSTVNIGGTATTPANINAGTSVSSMAYFDNLVIITSSVTNFQTTAYINVGKDLVINGTLNNNSSRTLLSGKLTHNSGGTYNSNTSILVLQGSGAQQINGTASTTSVNTILVNSGVTTLAHSVILQDSLKVTGGTFNCTNMTLRATTALSARIANKTGGTLSGNVTVQTLAPGGVTDWANIGSSGVSGLTLASWDNPATFPMTCNGCINGTTAVSPDFASAISYDETQSGNAAYVTMSSTDPLTPGKGFWMYMGLTQSNTADMLWSVTGAPVSGNVSGPNLTITGSATYPGYNLIANPYPSPISFSKVRASNPGMIANATYIYNADIATTVVWNGVVSNPAGYSSDVIPRGQGFYVDATATGALNYSESHKIPNNTSANPLQRSTESAAVNTSTGTVIRMNVSGGGYWDQTTLLFHPNGTTNYDTEYDGKKLYGSPGYQGYPGEWTARTAIATQIGTRDYAINTVPYPTTQSFSVPVIVRVYGSGSYTISGIDLQNIPGTSCISLFDKVTNITHDLRSGDYVCNINDTTMAARFVLNVCPFTITTDVKTQAAQPNNSVVISKDAQGVFVKFDYAIPTDATIYATNILGQTIMVPKKVKASNDTFYLNINSDDQLLFVTVVSGNERTTRKILNTK